MSGSWYEDGLEFSCTQCGKCCSGLPGTVTVDDAEVTALAARIEVSEATFRSQYTRNMSDGTVSLREKSNYDCVFYGRGHGCLVYEDRPTQCRTWPFWKSIVETPESWAEEAQSCPGMNSGRLYTLDEIEDRARKTP